MTRRTYLLAALPVVTAGLVFALSGDDRSAGATLVPLEQVPAGLVTTAKDKLPGVAFDHARRLGNGNYEIRGKSKSGKVREVELTAEGDVVEVE